MTKTRKCEDCGKIVVASESDDRLKSFRFDCKCGAIVLSFLSHGRSAVRDI
jgi:hypothetical protein